LILDYDKHIEIFSFAPEMIELPEVYDLIESLRPVRIQKQRKRQQ